MFEVIEEHFDGAWMADDRVRLIREDGRSYLAHTPRSYDIISLEVGQLFRPGVATFYTAEFYRRARERLRPGGILTQLVPLPFLTKLQLRRVVASLLEAFPQSVLWYNTSELLLIGFTAEPVLRQSRLQLLTDDRGVHEDLKYAYWGGPAQWLNRPEVFLAGFLCGPDSLARLAGGAPPYTDHQPELEYATSRVQATDVHEVPLVELLEGYLDPIDRITDSPTSPATRSGAEVVRNANMRNMIAHALLRQVEVQKDLLRGDQIANSMTEALQLNPDNVACNRMMAEAQLGLGRLDEALRYFTTALAVRPDDVPSLLGSGFILLRGGQVDAALANLQMAVAIRPDYAVAHNLLGAALGHSGRAAEAITHFERAVTLDPDMKEARDNLERARQSLGAPPS